MLQKQPEHMGASLHVFQRDVWDLNVGREIAFHDLSSGDEIRKPLPPADCIVSNLPFVQFEDVEEANPTVQHDAFDRTVFTFTGDTLPGYHVAYVDEPVRQCGRGNRCR